MPKVGSKKFAYTPKGMTAAKREAKASGMPMKSAKSMPMSKPMMKQKEMMHK